MKKIASVICILLSFSLMLCCVSCNSPSQGEKGETGAQGPQGEKGETGETGNGILSIELTSSSNGIDTYTITYTNGDSDTFMVTNGVDGKDGVQGVPGEDGHTPEITIGSNGNWFVDGQDTGVSSQGEKGETGAQGPQGETGLSAYEIYLKYYPFYEGTEKEWIDDLVLGLLNEKYTVIWQNADDTIIEVDYNVGRRERAEYNGVIPTIEPDAQYEYIFKGWSPEINLTTEDVYYVAQYERIVRTYTVKWMNYNGEILEVDYNVPYGDFPVYNGNDPYKEGNTQYEYTFNSWDKVISEVIGDITYTATYSEIKISDWLIELDESNSYAIVINYEGADEEVVVPSTYLGKPVKLIKSNAFTNNAIMTSLIIPNSVENIELGAINNCVNLNCITLPFIGDSIDNSTNAYFSYIFGNSSDYYQYKYIPESLSKVTVTSSTIIGKGAFEYARNIKEIVLPKTLKRIESNAFYECRNLEKLILSDCISYIGTGAFDGCYNLVFNEQNKLYYLGSETNDYFCLVDSKNTSTTTVTINEETKIIYDRAFDPAYAKFTTITIPNGVKFIGSYAFRSNGKLVSIELPNTIEYIANSAFLCLDEDLVANGSMENVFFNGTIDDWLNITFEDSASNPMVHASNFYLSDPNGDVEFNGTKYLLLSTLHISSNIQKIGENQFFGFKCITSVEISDSTAEIGRCAFMNCELLTTVVIPKSVYFIDINAFKNCSNAIICCEANSQPNTWSAKWNPSNCKVYWGW